MSEQSFEVMSSLIPRYSASMQKPVLIHVSEEKRTGAFWNISLLAHVSLLESKHMSPLIDHLLFYPAYRLKKCPTPSFVENAELFYEDKDFQIGNIALNDNQ